MFKLGDVTATLDGRTARIICVDAGLRTGTYACNVIAVVKSKSGTNDSLMFYTDNGKFAGTGNSAYDLLSLEPTAEEADLIQQIGDLVEGSSGDREAAMLKIIRKLRQK